MSAQTWGGISSISFSFPELFSHLPHKLFAGTTNIPLISLMHSPVLPARAAGRSYLFAIDHGSVAHTLESSRLGEAAIKQRGAV